VSKLDEPTAAQSGAQKFLFRVVLLSKGVEHTMREARERCCPVRLTTALSFIGAVALVWPAKTWAWTDAPLCVAQQPQLSEYSQSERSSSLLCEPDSGYSFHEAFTLQQGPLWTVPISGDEARRALREADELAESAPADALLKLRLVERAMPRLVDRLAMQRAQLLMRLHRTAEACDAYREAIGSPERNVAAEARIGYVRCMLESGNKQGELELERLTQRYPALGERHALQILLARAREGWNNLSGAVPIYRSIALHAPETRAAADARAAMERLSLQGVRIPPYQPQELVDRAERLVVRGTVEAGRTAVAELLAMNLPVPQRGRAHLLAARVARMEGRWDAVPTEVAAAISGGVPRWDAERWLPRTAALPADPSVGELRVRKYLGGRVVKTMKPGQLRATLDIAVQNNVRDVASEALEAMAAKKQFFGVDLFSAAIYASGVASDSALLAAFDALRDVRGKELAARYYHARALERLGRTEEAQAEYHEVSLMDVGWSRYYGTWAEARLSGLQQAAASTCQRDARGACLPETGLMPRLRLAAPALAPALGAPNAAPALGAPALNAPALLGAPAPSPAGTQPMAAVPGVSAVFASERDTLSEPLTTRFGLPTKSDLRRETIVARLGALAAVHGGAYPWIARAADLAELERYDDAASEISEAYLAYRDARGGFRFRVGVESVLTNTTPPPHVCTGQVRKERLALDEWARLSLAEVADMLEEPGVALRLREQRIDVRPRAYSVDVERAAAKFGLDPNLLFAVMRQESVYYRQIVSFAGAVGLMQIMPHTGMRIARALGNTDFNPRELLDPRRNLEFAAWYLSSLINRFDGRVPLAIAAYNGGPHNVRLWMRAYPDDMPLDAFLERIPFKETNNYVRRVLTHYAAYRAQQNLAMLNLADTLPRQRPDAIAF